LIEAELETISNSLLQKGNRELADDEPPWMPEDAIASIIKHVKRTRESLGRQWFEEIEPVMEKLDTMDVSEVNSTFNKLSNSPAFLSVSQKKQASRMLDKVELQLNRIKIEWLVTKYRELEEPSRKEFLKQIGATVREQK